MNAQSSLPTTQPENNSIAEELFAYIRELARSLTARINEYVVLQNAFYAKDILQELLETLTSLSKEDSRFAAFQCKALQFLSCLEACLKNFNSLNLCIAYLNSVCTKKGDKITKKEFSTLIQTMKETERIDVGYVRVSSREQAEDSNALAQQTARIEATSAKVIFSDVQSGRRDDRPKLRELMALVQTGRVNKLFITRIDRLARKLILLKNVVEELEKYGTTLVILDQNLDLGTSQGRMMFNMLGSLAEWEVDMLSERVKHGKEYGRNNQWANGSRPFGYVVRDHKYYLDTRPFLCLLESRPENYLDYYQENVRLESID